MLAYSEQIFSKSPMEVEMLALAKGIKLLQLKGIKDIILEGDNLLLSEALRHQGSWPWQLMVIWRKIKDLESFDRWEANFCHWQMNQVADGLSKLYPPFPAVFYHALPPCICCHYFAGVSMDDSLQACDQLTSGRNTLMHMG